MKIDARYLKKLSSEEINSLPLAAYEGPIHVVDNQRDALLAVNSLRGHRALGFDTEKRPSFKKGQVYQPSLLQLSQPDAVYIFQLKLTGLPKELLNLFERKDIIKAGVAVGRDIHELREMKAFEPAGFIDLGDKAREAGLQHHGLRGLAAILLGSRVSKSARLTNWSKKELPEKALIYAATDAWLGLCLYGRMKKLRML